MYHPLLIPLLSLVLSPALMAKPNDDMTISALGKALIRQHEGLSLVCYIDDAGYWTIGYGHKYDSKDDCPPSGISITQAEILLTQDIKIAEKGVQLLVLRDLSQMQYDALVSWTYNLGTGALSKSTMLRRINEGKFDQAAIEMKRWVHAGGRKLVGLQIRRSIESFLFMNG